VFTALVYIAQYLNVSLVRMKKILTILLFSICMVCDGQEKILVAAASDLKFAMDSVIRVFEQIHPGKVNVTYGSSGKLTEQILNGAPFDLLLSADIAYPEMLHKANESGSEIYAYARGRIVLWSYKVDTQQKQMNTLLDPTVTRIAIANPRHAPYGKRAVESLEFYKVMHKVKPKLVYGENISQTARFVTTGAADAGIIALSLALAPTVKGKGGNYFLIPEQSHSPLIQGAVITRHGSEKKLAKAFFEFLRDSQTTEVLKYYGFTSP